MSLKLLITYSTEEPARARTMEKTDIGVTDSYVHNLKCTNSLRY